MASSTPGYFQAPKGSFQRDLDDLLVKHGYGKDGNEPTFVLAAVLKQSLDTFLVCAIRRDQYNGDK